MRAIMLYVCKCGKVKVCGNWEWNKTPVSMFIKRAMEREIYEISFEIITCPACLKNSNHQPK